MTRKKTILVSPCHDKILWQLEREGTYLAHSFRGIQLSVCHGREDMEAEGKAWRQEWKASWSRCTHTHKSSTDRTCDRTIKPQAPHPPPDPLPLVRLPVEGKAVRVPLLNDFLPPCPGGFSLLPFDTVLEATSGKLHLAWESQLTINMVSRIAFPHWRPGGRMSIVQSACTCLPFTDIFRCCTEVCPSLQIIPETQ